MGGRPWSVLGWNVHHAGPVFPRDAHWLGLKPSSSAEEEALLHCRRRSLGLLIVPFASSAMALVASVVYKRWRAGEEWHFLLFIPIDLGCFLVHILCSFLLVVAGLLLGLRSDPQRSRNLCYAALILLLIQGFARIVTMGVPFAQGGIGLVCCRALLLFPAVCAFSFGQVAFLLHLVHLLVVGCASLLVSCMHHSSSSSSSDSDSDSGYPSSSGGGGGSGLAPSAPDVLLFAWAVPQNAWLALFFGLVLLRNHLPARLGSTRRTQVAPLPRQGNGLQELPMGSLQNPHSYLGLRTRRYQTTRFHR